MAKGKKPTHADGDLILKLYDLRREAEMRKARSYVASQFWPESVEDVAKLFEKYPSQENNWLRQVTGYWEMAASLVLNGALNAQLFHANNGELYFVYAKFHPFLKQLRERFSSPEMLLNCEKLIKGTKEGRERLARMEKLQGAFRQRMRKSADAAD